jgi:hypothetical protein
MRSISESISSAPAIKIAEADARDNDDIGRSHVAAVADGDCLRRISPTNFDQYLSPGPSTDLVPSGRERAHLMGPSRRGASFDASTTDCARYASRAHLRPLPPCAFVLPAATRHVDVNELSRRLSFFYPFLFVFPLPPPPSSPSYPPPPSGHFRRGGHCHRYPPVDIGTATLPLNALLQGYRVVLVSN